MRFSGSRRWRVCILFAVVLSMCTSLPVTASAADPVAEALFREAIALMKKSEFAQACPKLEASQAREAKSGTLLVLGSCHEQLGKMATAWAEYTEAATLARTEGREENAATAQEFADAVAPLVSNLVIAVPSPPDAVAITVKLDDAVVSAASFNTPLPLDPGDHVVRAAAPGYRPWSHTVTIGAKADQQTLTIPALEALPVAPPPSPDPAVAPVPVAPVNLPPRPASPADTSSDDAVPAWVWVVGGVGVAMMAASIAFRVDQSAAGGALDDNCGADRTMCPASYDFEADRSRELRDFGLFVGLGAGGLVAVGIAVVGLF